MGQRFQIYIQVPNPAKNLSKSPGDNFYKVFGTKTKSILGFYFQWLYGASAVNTGFYILDFLKKNRFENQSEWYRMDLPDFANFKTKDQYVTNWLSLLNLRGAPIHPEVHGRTFCFDEGWFLNDDPRDSKFIQDRYDCIDNNDGVLIIDVETLKYCYVNIGTHYPDEQYKSACDLPQYKPVAASEYFSCYYPEHDNTSIKDAYAPFELLTEKNILKMFPGMKTVPETV